MTKETSKEQILHMAQDHGLITARKIRERGIHPQILKRLVESGELERVARGCYRLVDYPFTEHHGLVLTAAAAPSGVVCLLSALQFHEIGTQNPYQVWIALDRRTRYPAIDYPPLRVLRFSGEAFTAGVEEHRLEGKQVRIYGVAKTLADCFKYRNKIGLDVALEALNDAWRHRRFTMDEINRYARICRVYNVMRPYLEGLVG